MVQLLVAVVCAPPSPLTPLAPAGGVSGATGVLAGAPLDTIRVRQQQPGAGVHSIAAVLRRTTTNEGVRALFRGLSYPLACAAFVNALVFHSYGLSARHFAARSGQEVKNIGLNHVFWSGCIAGAAQTVVLTPVDVLKIRLQLQTAVPGAAGYVGPLAMLRRLLLSDGVRGLFRGLGITAIRDVPSFGVYFAVFEAAREAAEPGCRAAGAKNAPLVTWAAGGLAGAVSWIAVYPFDVLKSRIQSTPAATSRYRGWIDCAAVSFREGGGRVFVRGLPATLSRAFVTNGVIFTAYQAAHEMLQT